VARLEVVPFADEHLEDAARLLAARHADQRRVEPLLPGGFENPAAAGEELASAWRSEDASGAAALREGRLVAYMIGAPRDVDAWGANIWIEAAGHAAENVEEIRDAYGTAASRWVDEGRLRHYALVPATDPELVDAWFRLGFGQQQAQAVREVPQRVDVDVPAGFEIREPTVDDVEALLDVELTLPAHQRASPVFSGRPLPTPEEQRAEWAKTLADDEEHVLIGCHDSRPVACWSTCDARLATHYSALTLPERASYLAFAVTLPEARGAGIGVALTQAALAAAGREGYAAMVTDWRVTNLLASRFWPRRGFRTMFFRLYRSIP
jgi:ribosomal protein S18 acetylase RimI-like enzyme